MVEDLLKLMKDTNKEIRELIERSHQENLKRIDDLDASIKNLQQLQNRPSTPSIDNSTYSRQSQNEVVYEEVSADEELENALEDLENVFDSKYRPIFLDLEYPRPLPTKPVFEHEYIVGGVLGQTLDEHSDLDDFCIFNGIKSPY